MTAICLVSDSEISWVLFTVVRVKFICAREGKHVSCHVCRIEILSPNDQFKYSGHYTHTCHSVVNAYVTSKENTVRAQELTAEYEKLAGGGKRILHN
jgi:hypothetical protein